MNLKTLAAAVSSAALLFSPVAARGEPYPATPDAATLMAIRLAEPASLADITWLLARHPPLAVAPKRILVCIFRGFRASGQSSAASIDPLKAAIEADQTIGKIAVVQLCDPGTGGSKDGPDDANRFLNGAQADDKVVIIGHSHGGHRGYLFARKPPNGKLDLFIAVDPIDYGRCKDILTCAGYGKADQSGVVEAAIDDVPWADLVQRDPGATNFLKGYRIGKDAEAECPLVKLASGAEAFIPKLNSTCVVPNPTGHSAIAADARVYAGIIELIKKVTLPAAPAPYPAGLAEW